MTPSLASLQLVINTYREQKYGQVSPEAGTGMLYSLGATGLKLTGT